MLVQMCSHSAVNSSQIISIIIITHIFLPNILLGDIAFLICPTVVSKIFLLVLHIHSTNSDAYCLLSMIHNTLTFILVTKPHTSSSMDFFLSWFSEGTQLQLCKKVQNGLIHLMEIFVLQIAKFMSPLPSSVAFLGTQ